VITVDEVICEPARDQEEERRWINPSKMIEGRSRLG
jgi:hypothetical protein